MKILQKIDLRRNNEPTYTTYFYHKYNKFVYEVLTNGDDCVASIREECGINRDMKSNSTLPKYILKNL